MQYINEVQIVFQHQLIPFDVSVLHRASSDETRWFLDWQGRERYPYSWYSVVGINLKQLKSLLTLF